ASTLRGNPAALVPRLCPSLPPPRWRRLTKDVMLVSWLSFLAVASASSARHTRYVPVKQQFSYFPRPLRLLSLQPGSHQSCVASARLRQQYRWPIARRYGCRSYSPGCEHSRKSFPENSSTQAPSPPTARRAKNTFASSAPLRFDLQ